jgi:hypothetical protein
VEKINQSDRRNADFEEEMKLLGKAIEISKSLNFRFSLGNHLAGYLYNHIEDFSTA